MSEAAKPPMRKRPQSSTWWRPDLGVDVDTLPADRQLAHELVVRRVDLTPSVELIMNSKLDEPGRCVALRAFGTALDTPGDPNRDPRVAIAAAS